MRITPRGVEVNGVPIDPQTNRPVPHPGMTVTEVTYVDWRFVDPPVSVLGTLTALVGCVTEAVNDIRHAASL
jgi:hypothetical protein